MSQPAGATVTFYTAAQVAEILQCSQWWVKEQARNRRIPYCWIGGSYRFTQAHLVEIAQRFEKQATQQPDAPPVAKPVQRQRPPGRPTDQQPITLHARPPRRIRETAQSREQAA